MGRMAEPQPGMGTVEMAFGRCSCCGAIPLADCTCVDEWVEAPDEASTQDAYDWAVLTSGGSRPGQSQRSLSDQLEELHRWAVQSGLYDAADWLRDRALRREVR